MKCEKCEAETDIRTVGDLVACPFCVGGAMTHFVTVQFYDVETDTVYNKLFRNGGMKWDYIRARMQGCEDEWHKEQDDKRQLAKDKEPEEERPDEPEVPPVKWWQFLGRKDR